VLRSAGLSVGVTATVHADTDLTLVAEYHGYVDDPTRAGIFSVATVGRPGPGALIAPLRYLVRPEAVHRFGNFSLQAWLEGGEYVSGAGQGTSGAGLKAQYKFTQSFRTWVSAGGRRDVDSEGQIIRSGTLALGAAYRF
jgi:hypothetical protein